MPFLFLFSPQLMLLIKTQLLNPFHRLNCAECLPPTMGRSSWFRCENHLYHLVCIYSFYFLVVDVFQPQLYCIPISCSTNLFSPLLLKFSFLENVYLVPANLTFSNLLLEANIFYSLIGLLFSLLRHKNVLGKFLNF